MGKMILGTVQLGMQYGINNNSGKPKMQEAVKMLEYAHCSGINILDTASAYGNSEEIIGHYIKNTGNVFKVCTKLPVNANAKCVTDYYEKSKNKLHIKKIYIYYLHRFEQCKYEDMLKKMVSLKNQGAIKNIGVSIYQPEELEYIVTNLYSAIDVVQLPFNVFDNVRWVKSGLLNKAIKNNIKVYARSVFLQGLIFLSENSELSRKMGIQNSIMKLREIAKERNSSVAQLAIDYVNTVGEIEQFLIGCETLKQLQENVALSYASRPLECEFCKQIEQISCGLDEKTIDPRMWT